MPNWKKVAVSGSAASFSSLYVDTSVTASIFSGSQFIGNLSGTASQAVSSSFALTASFFSGSVTNAVSSSYTLTASYVNPLVQNVYITGGLNVTGSTVQVGNNTLLGNTTLSGSIIISGSQGQPNPTISVFGDLNQTGYTRYLPVTNNIDNAISASYIFVSGSTQDLYFSQNSKGYSNVTRLRWLEGNMYTGLLNGGVITTSSSTVYTISSGSGIIVNLNASLNDNPYPTIQYLNWGNLSQSIAPLSASYDQAFVGIDSTGNIFQQGGPFSDGQFDALINIGVVLFQNNSTINGVKTQPSVAYGFEQAQNVFNRAFGPLKLSGYTVAVSGSSTGSIVVGSGTAYSPGSNYINDPNNSYYTTDSGTNTSKFFRYYQSGSGVNPFVYLTNGGSGYPDLDPVYYDNNGTLDTVGASNYSIQRLFWYPNSVTKAVVAYYGNARYGTMSEGIANLNIEPFTEAPNTAANAIYLGAYVIKGGTNTTLQNPAHYTWIPGGLFRSVGGSGGGGSIVTQTLSGLSDVSISGQTDGQPLAWSATAGKWINSTYISASVAGNATSATSASYAATSSWALNAVSSSFATTASYVVLAQTASYVLNAVSSSRAVSSSYALTASYLVSSSYALSSSYAISASYAISSSHAPSSLSASYAVTASYLNTLTQSVLISGSLTVSGSLSVYGQSGSSIQFTQTDPTTGSLFAVNNSNNVAILNVFANNVTTFTGSVQITGSLRVTQGVTASLLGTASYATQALSSSYAVSASYAPSTPGFPFTGSAQITGSLGITGSLTVTQGITGSLLGTASYATQALSSSYALTASYALNAGGGGGGATTGSNTFFGNQTISGSLIVTGSTSANIFLYPQTASNVVVPSGYNGLLITPIQLQGSSSVEIGGRLVIL